jgi:predicted RNA-binding Zn-ribbon protein involved in translation (DUF1610 family)
MSSLQKLFVALLPKKWAESMEAESRTWMARCSSCGFEQPFWEVGGIRWKAAGTDRRYLSCPKCGRSHWHTIYKPQPSEQSTNKA